MFVVDPKKWHPPLAPGQERMLIEMWLETLAADTAPLDWPPVCSTFQTLRNLIAALQEVERDILYPTFREWPEAILPQLCPGASMKAGRWRGRRPKRPPRCQANGLSVPAPPLPSSPLAG